MCVPGSITSVREKESVHESMTSMEPADRRGVSVMETGQNRDDAPVKPQCPRTPHTQHQDVICRPNTDPPGTPRDDDVMQSKILELNEAVQSK